MIDLLSLEPAGLRAQLAEWGEPAYRAAQIERWIFHDLVDEFGSMSNLPGSLRERLAASCAVGRLHPVARQVSIDGLTQKVVFSLADGETLETVLMHYADAPESPELAEGEDREHLFHRRTVCISTQVGCPVGCPFCATGQAGFIRNLTVGEIVGQVLFFARVEKGAGYVGLPLTNIVIMGMGEPLMKFDITWQAIQALFDPARFGLGARRITVSTSGMVPGIQRFARLRSQINLAISLHATDDRLRDRLVPLNRRYPLGLLMQAARDYVRETHRRITFEYALIEGVNDSPEQASALSRMVGDLLCHVNLIPLNPTANSDYHRPSYERVRDFEHILTREGIPTTLRVEKGIEITAGCGQLRQQLGGKPSGHGGPRTERNSIGLDSTEVSDGYRTSRGKFRLLSLPRHTR